MLIISLKASKGQLTSHYIVSIQQYYKKNVISCAPRPLCWLFIKLPYHNVREQSHYVSLCLSISFRTRQNVQLSWQCYFHSHNGYKFSLKRLRSRHFLCTSPVAKIQAASNCVTFVDMACLCEAHLKSSLLLLNTTVGWQIINSKKCVSTQYSQHLNLFVLTLGWNWAWRLKVTWWVTHDSE